MLLFFVSFFIIIVYVLIDFIDTYIFLSIADILFFFFQAEDGIRDVAVTGVQTCALPICNPAQPFPVADCELPGSPFGLDVAGGHAYVAAHSAGLLIVDLAGPKPIVVGRSEERRVGKECRSRWSPYH